MLNRKTALFPLMPLPLAHQAMISRSQVSSAKATRSTSPFQQATSKVSEVQRKFGRLVMMRPSCTRPMEYDENPNRTAEREVFEEIGFKVYVGVPIGTFEFSSGER